MEVPGMGRGVVGMTEVAAGVAMLLGVALLVIASIGLLRLPDPLCRAHAVAKAVSLGISLILLGAWLVLGTEEAGLKLGLAIGFQLATIPVASHLLSRAAYRGGLARDRAGEPKGRGVS